MRRFYYQPDEELFKDDLDDEALDRREKFLRALERDGKI